MDKKTAAHNGECVICKEKFTDYKRHRSRSHPSAEHGETTIRATSKLSTGVASASGYRIAAETGIEGPLRLQIGDIRDITSEVIPFDRANECLKFTEADAREAGLTW